MGGSAYQFTTYQDSDFAVPDGQFGLPLHHPRFLEWVGAPEYARLLGRDSSEWIRSMSQLQTIDAARQLLQTIDAARQLQHDTCLINSNLNVQDQYVLCLQWMASKLLELTVWRHDFMSKVYAVRPFTWKQ